MLKLLLREAGKRVLGMRPFDVQMIGAMVLHGGQIEQDPPSVKRQTNPFLSLQ